MTGVQTCALPILLGGDIRWDLIGNGALIGVVVIVIDEVLARTGRYRLPPLAVGIGIYLPMSATFAVVLGAIAMFIGLSWQAALIAGLGCAMSSTALVISSLAERQQLMTRHGREAFAILLFQDLAVIPLLALLPLLGSEHTQGGANWMAAVKGIAAIGTVIAGSRLIVRPALKFIAHHSSREVFTAAALLLVVGTSLVMEKIGLSMSLGAFLAGVLLADSEFRHELEADIEPFKGLLLGLFFMAVGMSANLGLLLTAPLLVCGLALALMAAKFIVMLGIGRVIKATADSAQRLAVSLA